MPLTIMQRLAAGTAALLVAIVLFEATSFLLERIWDDAPVAEGFATGAALFGGVLTARAIARAIRERQLRRLPMETDDSEDDTLVED